MGYGGGYLHSGLAGIAGERYAADSLRAPETVGLTQTARGGTTRAMYGPPPTLNKVYGQVALEEIEGHQVDPYYDVRGSGLGRVPTLTRRGKTERVPLPPTERSWQGRGERAQASAETLPVVPASIEALSVPEASTPFELPPALLYAGLAFVVWRMVKR